MSVWVTARIEPTSMVITGITPMTIRKSQAARSKATYRTRSSPPNAATLVHEAMNAVIGVGAPWYTSGVQTWNGTAAALNSSPMATIARPVYSRNGLLVESWMAAWMSAKVIPDRPAWLALAGRAAYPYSSAMPNRKNAEANAPSRKYFSAASWDSSRRRRARPHIRYSGRGKTPRGPNMADRGFGETKAI